VQPYCPCSRDLNWTGKGLNSIFSDCALPCMVIRELVYFFALVGYNVII
jgi:hypothetical protein